MTKRIALIVIGFASPSILVAMLFEGSIAETVFVTLSLLLPPSLIALGAARRGRVSAATIGLLAALVLLLEGGALAILWLSRATGEARGLAGLPPAAVIMVGVLGLGLLLLVPLAHGALQSGDDPSGISE